MVEQKWPCHSAGIMSPGDEEASSADEVTLADVLPMLDLDAGAHAVWARVQVAGNVSVDAPHDELTSEESRAAAQRLLDAGVVQLSPDGSVQRRDMTDVRKAAGDYFSTASARAATEVEKAAAELVDHLVGDVADECVVTFVGDETQVDEQFFTVARLARTMWNAYPVVSTPLTLDYVDKRVASEVTTEAECSSGGFDVVDRLRVLHPLERLYFSSLRAAVGADVALARRVVTRVSLVDERYVVVPVDPADHLAGLRVVDDVHAVQRAKAYLWGLRHAAESLDHVSDITLSPTLRAVVRAMAAGDKDETIARRLRVSDRTVRRMVAELIELTGTESRFQLAVEAARRGWLDDSGR